MAVSRSSRIGLWSSELMTLHEFLNITIHVTIAVACFFIIIVVVSGVANNRHTPRQEEEDES